MRGGSEQVIYELGKKISKEHNLTILTPKIKNTKKYENFEGIDIYRFPYLRGKIIDMLSSQISLIDFFPKIFKKQKFDIIHMFHVYQLGGATIILKRRYNLPLLTSLFGWDTYDPISRIPQLFKPYLSWVMNNSDSITAPSRHLKKAAEMQGCNKEIEIIPHGISSKEKRIKVDIRKRHDIKNNEKIVFSLQRLDSIKGLEYLADAISYVLDKETDIKFIIGGRGPKEKKLRRKCRSLGIENNVIITGFIKDEELPNYYKSADLFVLSSLYEAFGVVYVDALSFGVPVVTTRCGGSEDIINEKNGILVPKKDAKALSEAILKALDKKWNKKQIKEEAKKRYNYENIVKKYLSLYNSLTHK